jgi:hypothetical protein
MSICYDTGAYKQPFKSQIDRPATAYNEYPSKTAYPDKPAYRKPYSYGKMKA